MKKAENGWNLGAIMILMFKDEMKEKGIIPDDVNFTELTYEQKESIKQFINQKLEEKRDEDVKRNGT